VSDAGPAAPPGPGRVYLVGGGPGDPRLLTLRGKECLERADLVVYDRLVDPALLDLAPAGAERIYVGKQADRHAMRQEEINRLLVERGQAGQRVVRLKGGDPFVFGRGGEEAAALAAAGVPFEVVPGVTSAVAVPAYAGIPVTHRELTSSFAVITGHEDPERAESRLDWAQLATGIGTLVFLMGVGSLEGIAHQLIAHGRSPTTPVAVIEWGTRPTQRTVVATLADVADAVQRAGLGPPAITVVGEVVGLRATLRWFDRQPLFGKRVLITRTREQAGTLAAQLRERGALPIELPTIRTEPPVDWAAVDDALDRLASFAWVVFTSANGVRYFCERLWTRGQDLRALHQARVAAIGPATAEALAQWRLRADLVPTAYVAEAVIAALAPRLEPGQAVLLPRAEAVREALAAGLAAAGARVEEVAVYRTGPDGDAERARELLASGQVDVVTFTSSSTAQNLVALLGDQAPTLLAPVRIASIGPITSATARDLGLKVTIEASEHTIPGLVAALERALSEESA
jgi:uroporphyrinogen III methyltransferase/synthase